jgi:hypothetical protein
MPKPNHHADECYECLSGRICEDSYAYRNPRAGHVARDAEVEALRAENERLLQLLAKAADTMDRAEATVNALIAALGIPPAPPKQAPWEAAFREWEKSGEDAADYQEVWQEAVKWFMGEAEKCKLPGVVFGEQYFSLDTLRRNIMGDEA